MRLPHVCILKTCLDGSTVIECKLNAISSKIGCNSCAHPNRPFPHLHTLTRAHVHTCTLFHLRSCRRCRPAQNTPAHLLLCPCTRSTIWVSTPAIGVCGICLHVKTFTIMSPHSTAHHIVPLATMQTRVKYSALKPHTNTFILQCHITLHTYNMSVRRQSSTAQRV